jgi:hypothetical protein
VDEDRDRNRGRRMRDVGIYTTIPTMLVVGPVLGYLLGHWAAGRWGHDAAFETGGAVLGLIAAIRQVWLLLKLQGRRR